MRPWTCRAARSWSSAQAPASHRSRPRRVGPLRYVGPLTQCTVTDYPDPHILAALERNVAALQARAPHALPLHVHGLAWGNDAHAERACAVHGGRYDVVLAADVLWVSSQHENLLDSICALLARQPGARCLVVAGYHTGRPATERFFLAARTRGLVPDAATHLGGMYERSIFGEERACALSAAPDTDLGDISARAQWVRVGCLRWTPEALR